MPKTITLEIEYCDQCPHYTRRGTPNSSGFGYQRNSTCVLTGKNPDQQPRPDQMVIPDWCPLEEKDDD